MEWWILKVVTRDHHFDESKKMNYLFLLQKWRFLLWNDQGVSFGLVFDRIWSLVGEHDDEALCVDGSNHRGWGYGEWWSVAICGNQWCDFGVFPRRVVFDASVCGFCCRLRTIRFDWFSSEIADLQLLLMSIETEDQSSLASKSEMSWATAISVKLRCLRLGPPWTKARCSLQSRIINFRIWSLNFCKSSFPPPNISNVQISLRLDFKLFNDTL